MTGQGEGKLPIRLIAVIAGAAALVVALAWIFGGMGSSDSFYDKSAENPILPPGVRPGEQPPSAINPSTGAPSSMETGGR